MKSVRISRGAGMGLSIALALTLATTRQRPVDSVYATPSLSSSARAAGQHSELPGTCPEGFNDQFDRSGNGLSYSRDADVTACEVHDAIEAFRAGVVYGDTAALKRVVAFPFTVTVYRTNSVDEKGTPVTMKSEQEWSRLRTKVFTPAHLAAVSCAHLGNAVIDKRYGTFGIGSIVWFVAGPGHAPTVKRVVLGPLTDAQLARVCREHP